MVKKPSYEELEQRVMLHIQQTMFGVIQWNLDFEVIEWNPAAEQIFGYSREEALGQHAASLIVPESVIPHVDNVRNQLLEQSGGTYSTNENVTKDGSILTCEWFNTPLTNNEGIITGVASLVQDITDRKRAEESLRESEEKYRGLFDESIAAVYLFDEKKNFLDSNQAGLDLLGYPREELLNMSIPDVDADPIVVLSAHEQLLSGDRIINYEHKLQRKDGKVISVLNNSRPLTNDDEQVVGMQSTLIDITDRKRAEEELQKAHDELEQRVAERTAELDAKNISLEEMNTSIRFLLKKREEDKKEMEDKMLMNLKELVIPYLEKLKACDLDEKQNAYAGVLESNLNDIFSPLLRRLSSKELKLTPQEIIIASHIRQGMTTKEIAEMMGLSRKTIESHRKSIRRKFGLQNRKENLRTHLMSIQ